jgi:hypothetical protein
MASRVLGVGKTIIVRLYALAILLVVVWAGYTAVSYLFHAVFQPVQVPPWFLEWRGHLDEKALREPDVPGVTGPAARAPLAHFHAVDRWFQLDPHNGCTVSGCHMPLPHTKSKALRAFANFHSTFIECMMCHETVKANPAPAMWVSISTGLKQGPPPMLQLIRALEADAAKIRENPASVQPTIDSLLRETVTVLGGDPLLEYLHLEIHNAQPGSPVWIHAMDQLSQTLPAYARGEYGAKIAPQASDSDLKQAAAELAEQTKAYQAAAAGSPAREELYKKIHAPVVARPKGCLLCHGGKPARLDFESLGYSASRAAQLHGAPIAKLMQQVQEGHPFYLPGIQPGPSETRP